MFTASTLPHMTSTPSVSVQPEPFEKRRNSRGSRENLRKNSQGERDGLKKSEREKRRSQDVSPVVVNGTDVVVVEKAPVVESEKRQSVPVEVYQTHRSRPKSLSRETTIDDPPSPTPDHADKVTKPERNAIKLGDRPTFDPAKKIQVNKEPKPSRETSKEQDKPDAQTKPKSFETNEPRVQEIGRYSTREVIRYTEVEQRETVLAPVIRPAPSNEVKLEHKVVTRPTPPSTDSQTAYKGSHDHDHPLIIIPESFSLTAVAAFWFADFISAQFMAFSVYTQGF